MFQSCRISQDIHLIYDNIECRTIFLKKKAKSYVLKWKNMKKIYTNSNSVEMGYFKSLLEGNGFEVFLKNELLTNMTGENIYLELYVPDESYTEAKRMIEEIEKSRNLEQKNSTNGILPSQI